MARPKGTKNIETPEKLWEIFLAYKNYVKENPIKVQDYVGKDGDAVYREKERPLTIEGFECYCFENGIIGDLSHYFANTGNRYLNYLNGKTRPNRRWNGWNIQSKHNSKIKRIKRANRNRCYHKRQRIEIVAS
jgi:hypothetical protein